jgi:uncharacterized membrane protein
VENFHVLAGNEKSVGEIQVRQIEISDVFEALRLGIADFWDKPSHYVFLCLIYPIAGIVLMTWTSGGNAFQLVYPLLSGFALLGPFAAISLYEISRRRELGLDTSWKNALEVRNSPAIPSIIAIGAMLVGLFVIWLYAAQAIYTWLYGPVAPLSIPEFVLDVLTTARGWTLIIVGNGIGFAFALIVLATTVIAFPLLLDQDVGAVSAVRTSVKAVMMNPIPMLAWGLIVSATMIAGSVPLLAGLALVLPILGHSTWHLYRKVIVSRSATK